MISSKIYKVKRLIQTGQLAWLYSYFVDDMKYFDGNFTIYK